MTSPAPMTRSQAARISNLKSRPFVEITVISTWDGYRRAVAIPLNTALRAKCTREKATGCAGANPLGVMFSRGGYDCVAPDAELVARVRSIAEGCGFRVWENK